MRDCAKNIYFCGMCSLCLCTSVLSSVDKKLRIFSEIVRRKSHHEAGDVRVGFREDDHFSADSLEERVQMDGTSKILLCHLGTILFEIKISAVEFSERKSTVVESVGKKVLITLAGLC